MVSSCKLLRAAYAIFAVNIYTIDVLVQYNTCGSHSIAFPCKITVYLNTDTHMLMLRLWI